MFFKRDNQVDKHLSYNKQLSIADEVERIAKKQPLNKNIFLLHPHYLAILPCFVFSFAAWRAGFRGYNLVKFGKGRGTTAFMSSLYPAYGAGIHLATSEPCILEPFRVENPWYYGLRFALYQQVANLGIFAGNIAITYIFGSAYGMIELPGRGLRKLTYRDRIMDMIFKRLKPYRRGLIITSLSTSVFMFAVGVGAYSQSRAILATMNRKSLGLKED